MSEQPPEVVLATARADLQRIKRTTGLIAAAAMSGALSAGALLLAGLRFAPVALAGGLGLTLGFLFGIAWWRVAAAHRATFVGPFERVHAVGWCRPPDGCNFAMFLIDREDGDEPDYVLRLPVRRQMAKSDAWLCGSPKPAMLGGLALLSGTGLLGAGRIVSRRAGLKRWRRKDVPPGKHVMRPPNNWLPRGGESLALERGALPRGLLREKRPQPSGRSGRVVVDKGVAEW